MIAMLVIYQGRNQRHAEYETNRDGSLMWFSNHEAVVKYCRQVGVQDRKNFLQVYEIAETASNDALQK